MPLRLPEASLAVPTFTHMAISVLVSQGYVSLSYLPYYQYFVHTILLTSLLFKCFLRFVMLSHKMWMVFIYVVASLLTFCLNCMEICLLKYVKPVYVFICKIGQLHALGTSAQFVYVRHRPRLGINTQMSRTLLSTRTWFCKINRYLP